MSEDHRITSFEQALERLQEVLDEPKTDVVRDAAIKRFEFTFELSWKAVQKFLAGEGVSCVSPKNCFKEAYKVGLMKDSPLWVRMIEDRNMTVHTYNASVADEIYGRLSSYIPLFAELLGNLRQRKP